MVGTATLPIPGIENRLVLEYDMTPVAESNSLVYDSDSVSPSPRLVFIVSTDGNVPALVSAYFPAPPTTVYDSVPLYSPFVTGILLT